MNSSSDTSVHGAPPMLSGPHGGGGSHTPQPQPAHTHSHYHPQQMPPVSHTGHQMAAEHYSSAGSSASSGAGSGQTPGHHPDSNTPPPPNPHTPSSASTHDPLGSGFPEDYAPIASPFLDPAAQAAHLHQLAAAQATAASSPYSLPGAHHGK